MREKETLMYDPRFESDACGMGFIVQKMDYTREN